jgi:hypothetical protein
MAPGGQTQARHARYSKVPYTLYNIETRFSALCVKELDNKPDPAGGKILPMWPPCCRGTFARHQLGNVLQAEGFPPGLLQVY